MRVIFGRDPRQVRLVSVVEDLVGEVAALRARTLDLESVRHAAERLASDVRGLGQRLDLELEKIGAVTQKVVELDREVASGEERAEALRLKLVALAKMMDWEAESTRRALQALLDRTASDLNGQMAPPSMSSSAAEE